MKQICYLLTIILLSSMTIALTAQKATFDNVEVEAFSLKASQVEQLNIGKEFTQNSVLPLIINKQIYGLTFSGQIDFYADDSFARIILVDSNNIEYLMYEGYPLLVDENSATLTSFCQETCVLNGITAKNIKIELSNARVRIDSVSDSSTAPSISSKSLKTTSISAQNSFKVDMLNVQIKKKGLLWVAGDTSFSKRSYEEKKKMYGGKVPNFQGFEYYKGGVFQMPQAAEDECSTIPDDVCPDLCNTDNDYDCCSSDRGRYEDDHCAYGSCSYRSDNICGTDCYPGNDYDCCAEDGGTWINKECTVDQNICSSIGNKFCPSNCDYTNDVDCCGGMNGWWDWQEDKCILAECNGIVDNKCPESCKSFEDIDCCTPKGGKWNSELYRCTSDQECSPLYAETCDPSCTEFNDYACCIDKYHSQKSPNADFYSMGNIECSNRFECGDQDGKCFQYCGLNDDPDCCEKEGFTWNDKSALGLFCE